MPTFGSLFSGIGGLDLGLEQAGFACVGQVESDERCLRVLAEHWPGVARWRDARDAGGLADALDAVDCLAGGDPCPVRSRARGNRPSTQPDLSGYFLALVGRVEPRWVVRENVPAPDAVEFALGLEALGYRVVAVALDARDFTGQSRWREFLVGCPPERATEFTGAVLDAADGLGFGASRPSETTPVAACLTAHPMRLAAEDSYVFEPGRGLRVLDPREAESLQGFPRGWTAQLTSRQRRRVLGNAVCVPVAEWIGRRVIDVAET